MDVNANGQVVGYSNYVAGNPARHAFLWTAAGGMIDLGTLGGSHSQAFAVNAHGAVVGESTLSDGSNHAFFWTQAGGMIDLGTLGGTFSGATAINDQCHIVGFSLLPDGTSRHATLWYVKSCDTSTASDAK
jgi:probable HAF family extracellular repeat protein